MLSESVSHSKSFGIKGLPAGAKVEGRLVFLPDPEHQPGKAKLDFVGTVSDDLTFEPNPYYYLKYHRAAAPASLDDYNHPERQNHHPAAHLDAPVETLRRDLGVGVTLLCSSILYDTGLVADVHREWCAGDIADTIDLINMAIRLAVNAHPKFVLPEQTGVQKFIGAGYPSPERAYALFERIGAKSDALAQMSRTRLKRHRGHRLALFSGPLIDLGAQAPWAKDVVGERSCFSLLIDSHTGEPLGARVASHMKHGCLTAKHLVSVWSQVCECTQEAVFVMSPESYDENELREMHEKKISYLVPSPLDLSPVTRMIDEAGYRIYSAGNLLSAYPVYGLKGAVPITSVKGEFETGLYLFRDPTLEIEAMKTMRKELHDVAERWSTQPQACRMHPLFSMFLPAAETEALRVDAVAFNDASKSFGFYAYASNMDATPNQVMDLVALREDAVKCMYNMLKTMIEAQPRLSKEAFNGMVLTAFVGLGLLTELHSKLEHTTQIDSVLNSPYSFKDLWSKLVRLSIFRDDTGKWHFINTTDADFDLFADLGYRGLLEDAQGAFDRLTAVYMYEHLKDKNPEKNCCGACSCTSRD